MQVFSTLIASDFTALHLYVTLQVIFSVESLVAFVTLKPVFSNALADVTFSIIVRDYFFTALAHNFYMGFLVHLHLLLSSDCRVTYFTRELTLIMLHHHVFLQKFVGGSPKTAQGTRWHIGRPLFYFDLRILTFKLYVALLPLHLF